MVTLPRAAHLALLASTLPARSACAGNDAARRVVAEGVTVPARLDETTAGAHAAARDVATLESRVRALEAALSSSRAGEHGQAVLELSDIVARYPEHAQAVETQWWIGEECDRQRGRAALERVVRDHPTSDAAACARALLAPRSATSRAR